MKKILFLLLLNGLVSFAQEQKDTLVPKDLKEVIIIGKKAKIHEKQSKSLASIDEFLDKASQVDLIKRGAYAWEPIINNMATERTLITIDGMRIFGACTDKMDPITSYVEVSNLSEATIHSGQQGSCFGSTIGGAIDLKRNQKHVRLLNFFFVERLYLTCRKITQFDGLIFLCLSSRISHLVSRLSLLTP